MSQETFQLSMYGVDLVVEGCSPELREMVHREIGSSRELHIPNVSGNRSFRIEICNERDRFLDIPGGSEPIYFTAECHIYRSESGVFTLYSSGSSSRFLYSDDRTLTYVAGSPETDNQTLLQIIEGVFNRELEKRGLYPVHAAAVSRGEEAFILFGPPGSGKSGITLELLEKGFRLVSDDSPILTDTSQGLFVLPWGRRIGIPTGREIPGSLYNEVVKTRYTPCLSKYQLNLEPGKETSKPCTVRSLVLLKPWWSGRARAVEVKGVEKARQLFTAIASRKGLPYFDDYQPETRKKTKSARAQLALKALSKSRTYVLNSPMESNKAARTITEKIVGR